MKLLLLCLAGCAWHVASASPARDDSPAVAARDAYSDSVNLALPDKVARAANDADYDLVARANDKDDFHLDIAARDLVVRAERCNTATYRRRARDIAMNDPGTTTTDLVVVRDIDEDNDLDKRQWPVVAFRFFLRYSYRIFRAARSGALSNWENVRLQMLIRARRAERAVEMVGGQGRIIGTPRWSPDGSQIRMVVELTGAGVAGAAGPILSSDVVVDMINQSVEATIRYIDLGSRASPLPNGENPFQCGTVTRG